MTEGVVLQFDARKGEGMISPEGGGPIVSIHSSVVERAGISGLRAGDRVSFDVQRDPARGKRIAVNLTLL